MVRIINKHHSSTGALGQIVDKIQKIEKRSRIEVRAVHIPGVENDVADRLLRMSGEVAREERVTEGVLRHIQHQVSKKLGFCLRAMQRKALDPSESEHATIRVCVPAGDELLMLVRAAMSSSSPRVILAAKAVCDHWRSTMGLRAKTLGRFPLGRTIFEYQPGVVKRVQYATNSEWVFEIPRGQPLLEEWEAILVEKG
uniref:Uncharacterized protein n=1 Tax=Chromera velia CCMP2878 TaxID=1169474 RepID=A0A0G4HZI5_9ALVE|eukprot:Cvel_1580.t1-p1 / transcript=Cvel_1580.t1 / gene=Cvel_1580 / organism=Chromera_velia_CCMP2878 / gene_product=hypothetical protein / transcript_product=hypothetical protein / location=Cvel_scaffold56:89262-89852(-) / protein_length=197 / sequence_SO=supercontig / SO=protein_coding / is_pseudo=false